MTTIALDELTPGKPKRIEVNGESVGVVGNVGNDELSRRRKAKGA